MNWNLARIILAASALGASAAAQPVLAQDAEEATPTIEFDTSVALVSDYRFRGISYSGRDPAIQPDLTITHNPSGLYLNAWGSNVVDTGGDDIEVDLSLGWSREFGSTTVDVLAMYYVYPGASQFNYAEFTASVSQGIGDASLAAEVSYAPAQDNLGGLDNLYLGVSGEVPIKSTPLTLHGSVGWEDGAYGDGKLDWSLGTRFDLGKGFALDATYVDTARAGAIPEANAGAVVTLSKDF